MKNLPTDLTSLYLLFNQYEFINFDIFCDMCNKHNIGPMKTPQKSNYSKDCMDTWENMYNALLEFRKFFKNK